VNEATEINGITALFEKLSQNRKIFENLSKGLDCSIRFLNGSSRALLISLIRKYFQTRRIVIVCPDSESLSKWNLDLLFFFDEDNVLTLTGEQSTRLLQKFRQRNEIVTYETLVAFGNDSNSVLVVTPEIFNISLPSSQTFEERKTLKVSETVPYEDFIKEMLLKGFERKDFVEEQGDLAVRGAIIDIFPLGLDNPLRIEFFGDEIESIREFDIASQRSIKSIQSIDIITNIFDYEGKGAGFKEYLRDDDIIVLDSYEAILKNYPGFAIDAKNATIFLNSLNRADVEISTVPQPQYYSSIRNVAKEVLDLIEKKYSIYFVADGELLLGRLQEILYNAIEIEFEQNGNESYYDKTPEDIIAHCIWVDKTLSEGFRIDEAAIAIYTEHQIFGRERVRPTPRTFKGRGLTFKELRELNIGDFVVHIDKGIAKFDGLQRVKFGENYQDCVRLIFADDDIMFLNLNYLHKLQKYRAEEGVTPKLSKLGTSDWEKKKQRTKERLKTIARELIRLYAQRKSTKGYAFPADSIWQREFEASFIYEDTIDQADTTTAVKKDMESDIPMDRLICGDVGFGKTEVAIRAAFKCVQAGKQVAVLVPTTVLANQHELTFRDRLQKYPVNIESLSRFKSPKKIKQILSDLAKGKIDIIVGTHRLLSKDVKFKDLGLLIIDEEHRFGVTAKERLRQLKVNIDTLTMTATPIPRTLNFSLLGVRDLSLMETPPKNRLPIYTEVIYWDEKLIKQGIERELNRNGQVFFVVDQISRIERTLMRLLKLFPKIRIGVAHGKMSSHLLEKVMTDFIAGKYEILLTTKIIESGLDIPRANTIFIHNAQNFGVAELYQLRGRVGRSNIQAYCYLIIPPLETLTNRALQRLQALEEHTDLGSGMKLALRDLEIRGAGDIFGKEQSGFINEIGFEMFHKILDEAVKELKREEFPEVFAEEQDSKRPAFLRNEELQIEVDFDAFIPSEYVPNEIERFRYYKELYNIRDADELNRLQQELQDKFGKIPNEVENLFKIVNLRIKAFDTGIEKIKIKGKNLLLEFPDKSNKQFYDEVFPLLLDFAMSMQDIKLIEQRERLGMRIPIDSFNDVVEIVWRLKKTIEQMLG
jgi:transcription-repair coupling factor (superfamily II helicase)